MKNLLDVKAFGFDSNVHLVHFVYLPSTVTVSYTIILIQVIARKQKIGKETNCDTFIRILR